MSLNEKQKLAVDNRNCNLLISASAGSGKTKVLITRIADMIANHETEMTRLLVVTFTVAAASEMKQRLVKELSDKRIAETDESQRAYLLNQIEDINVADISTIHSFCSKKVRKYFYEIGVDPAFKLVNNDIVVDYKSQALKNIINEYTLKNDKDFINLYNAFNENRDITEFSNAIYKVCDILHATDSDFENKIYSSFSEEINSNIAFDYLNAYIVKTAKILFNYIQSECENILNDLEQKFITKIDAINIFLQSLNEKNSFVSNYNTICDFAMPKASKNMINNDIFQQFQGLIKKNLIDTIKECMCKYTGKESIVDNLNISKNMSFKLIEVSNTYQKEFDRIKRNNACLDLGDIETLMLEILKNDKLKDDIRKQYDFVFIDEYQDTNATQEAILSQIASENNLFMVGDVKQSIYGFRLCDSSIFAGKYALYQYEGKNKKIDLNKNYRSNKAILDYTNKVCLQLMTKSFGGIDYQNAQLEAGAIVNPVCGVPSVQINVIKEEDEDKSIINLKTTEVYSLLNETENFINKKDKIISAEAKIIAGQIAKLLHSELIVRDINGLETTKYIEYSDICILVKKKKDYSDRLASQLAEYGIPVSVAYSEDLTTHFEIGELINILKTIDNYCNDTALVNTMTSFVGGFTLNELSKIRLYKQDWSNFYDCVIDYRDNTSDELSTKISLFFEKINDYILQSAYLSVSELLANIISDNNIIHEFSMMKNGKQYVSNINLYLNALAEDKNNSCLSRYLDSLENCTGSQKKDISITGGENSVKLDTIHQSKGLEFPVVILTGAGMAIKGGGNKDTVIFNKNIGLSTKAYDINNRIKSKSIVENIIKLANNRDEYEEYTRLLYVALTRAKNNLIIVGSAKIDKIKPIQSEFDILSTPTYMAMLLDTLDKNSYEALMSGKTEIAISGFNDNDCVLKTYNLNEILEEKIETKTELTKKFDKTNDELNNFTKKVFEYEYLYKESENISKKSSVSEIYLSEDKKSNYIFNEKKNQTNENDIDIDYSEIGNAYHKVMQYVDFGCKNIIELDKNLKSLVVNGKLTLEDVELVDKNKILSSIIILESIAGGDKTLKEQPFIMLENYNNIISSSKVTDKISIEGIIDLVVINSEVTKIVDYKTTRASEEELINKYSKQLFLYKQATNYSIDTNNIECYIYSFYLDKLIKVI